MAARPQTAAKEAAKRAEQAAKEATEAAKALKEPQIPSAILKPAHAGPHPGTTRTHAHARTHSRARTPKAAIPPGREVKNFVDGAEAERLQALSENLQPGITVLIDRLKPSWASGTVDEISLKVGGVRELREYINEEHGGHVYKLSVCSPDLVPYFQAEMKIPGPPKKEGRVVTRDAWEGLPEQTAVQPVQQQAPAFDFGGIVSGLASIFTTIIESNNRSSDRIIDSVKEMATSQNESTKELIQNVIQTREGNQSFANQLTEVVKASNALGEVKEALRDDRDTVTNDDGSDPVTREFAKEAGKHFVKNFFDGREAKNKKNQNNKQSGQSIPDAVPGQRQSGN